MPTPGEQMNANKEQRAPIEKPARFQWPPLPLPEHAPAASASSVVATSNAPTPPVAPRVARAARNLEPDGLLARAERSLLGATSWRWRDLVARADWHADAIDGFCPRCGASSAEHTHYPASAEHVCGACEKATLRWERVVRLGSYRGALRQAIVRTKYEALPTLAFDVGHELGMQIRKAAELVGVDTRGAVVVPVPTSWMRRWRRGIDHSAVLAQGVAEALKCPWAQVLTRTHRPLQTGQSVQDRLRNIAGSMRAKKFLLREAGRMTLAGAFAPVILVDDVLTTGATMSEACRALKARAGKGKLTVWSCPAAVVGKSETDQS